MSASCGFFHELLLASPGITLSVSIFREIEIFDSATDVSTSKKTEATQTPIFSNPALCFLKNGVLFLESEKDGDTKLCV